MKIFIIKFLAFFVACLTCVLLQTSLDFSSVLASALVGFAGSFYPFETWVEKKGIHAVIYAGSFAGMCSREYLSGPEYIIFISLVGSTLYLLSKSYLNGFGGKLGTIAFVSSLFLILSRQLW